MKKFFKHSYLALILLILYLPITVLIIFSFNSGQSIHNFQSWSWDAYGQLFHKSALWQSLSVTLIVAFIATIIATILGTLTALGLSKTKILTRSISLGITNIPLVNADIVTAVSLMLLFTAFAFNFGIFTLILAHISFDIPYVIIAVLPKIRSIDNAQLEASQDLGATPWYTLRKIVLPTLKPAIISGAAIAFAMSFDDFIISYFTGGNAANVSTYIYSLKRIQPYINAFCTIIVVLVATLVISWNGYKIIKKQIKTRNEMIMNQTYRDKHIIKMEKNLNKFYLQLNMVKIVKSKKKKKRILFEPITAEQENYYINFFKNKISKHPKLIKKIIRLENKLKKEQVWVQQIKKDILDKKNHKEKKSRIRREKYRFLTWPWKLIATAVIMTGVFAVVIVFYVQTNTYDLTIANWGSYISPEILEDFENKYHVKVKYSTYDDDESLYAKLATTNYDVMVPSDYMVAQLAQEGRLLSLDKNKLGSLGLNSQLQNLMTKYTFTINSTSTPENKNLLDYSVPYFWGDLILVFNTVQDPNLLSELGINPNPLFPDPTQQAIMANWNAVKKAVDLGKKVVLNDDMHNLFMQPLVTLHYQNKWGENNGTTDSYKQNGNTFIDYVNAHSNKEIDDAADWLKSIIGSSNSSLQNDQIVDTIAVTRGWDVAVMYNGDLLGAMKQNFTDVSKYAVVRPYMGTNIWNDDMVISKKSQHQELAYDFVKYIESPHVQEILSETFGYTSPVQAALDIVKNKYPGTNWSNIYDPSKLTIAPNPNNGVSNGNPKANKGYYDGLYRRTFDPYMQTAYNKILANQGSNNTTALFIELGVVLLVILAFIGLIFAIK